MPRGVVFSFLCPKPGTLLWFGAYLGRALFGTRLGVSALTPNLVRTRPEQAPFQTRPWAGIVGLLKCHYKCLFLIEYDGNLLFALPSVHGPTDGSTFSKKECDSGISNSGGSFIKRDNKDLRVRINYIAPILKATITRPLKPRETH
jgi:hypothetical protein